MARAIVTGRTIAPKKRKRRKPAIKTPRRHALDSDREHWSAQIEAAIAAVDKARDKCDKATAALSRAWLELRNVERAADKIVSRVERERLKAAESNSASGGVRGNGSLLNGAIKTVTGGKVKRKRK